MSDKNKMPAIKGNRYFKHSIETMSVAGISPSLSFKK